MKKSIKFLAIASIMGMAIAMTSCGSNIETQEKEKATLEVDRDMLNKQLEKNQEAYNKAFYEEKDVKKAEKLLKEGAKLGKEYAALNCKISKVDAELSYLKTIEDNDKMLTESIENLNSKETLEQLEQMKKAAEKTMDAVGRMSDDDDDDEAEDFDF